MQEILAEWFPVFSFWAMVLITIIKIAFWLVLVVLISTATAKLRKVKI